MGRKCSVVGCHNSVGVHNFPQDLQLRRQWLRVIGLQENTKLAPHSGVCKQHFTRDSFANLLEVELGYARCLRLKSEAVPSLCLTPVTKKTPKLLPRLNLDPMRQFMLKVTREIGCQTDPVHVTSISKAPVPHWSEFCDTDSLMEISFPESTKEASTSQKRKRCEASAAGPSSRLNDSASSMNCTSSPSEVLPHRDRKYIVHERQLLGLFRKCPVCTNRCSVETMTSGTLLQVTQLCPHCEFQNQWSSQPLVNHVPSGNLQLSAAVLFTGASFSLVSKFLAACNIQGLSEQSFHWHQANFLIPAVSRQWRLEQDDLIRQAAGDGPLTLAHSAKHGSCAMMNVKSNKVIDIKVQSSEVGGRVSVVEGFEQSLTRLEERGVKVEAVVTDRHTGLKKFLRERRTDIAHYFDARCMGKSVGRRLNKPLRRKSRRDLRLWRRRLVNHLHWAASSSSTGQEAVSKWSSAVKHVQDVHKHDATLGPRHLHRRPGRKRGRPRTAARKRLAAALFPPSFLTDVEKISPLYQTANLEAFDSLTGTFSPKTVAFSPKGALARLQLAALSYNEKATQSRPAAGDLTSRARAVKSRPASLYLEKLMTLLFKHVAEDAPLYQEPPCS